MGEMSDKVMGAAKETASDALESGKQICCRYRRQELASSLPGSSPEIARKLPNRVDDIGGSGHPART